MKLINKPFVGIVWQDAHCISGASEMAEHEIPHSPALYTVYGFVLRNDEIGVTLATEVSEQNTYRSINFIPAGMIVEIVPLKVGVMKPKKAKAILEQLEPGSSL